MASLGLTARMLLGNPSFTGTPTHEGGGCPGQPWGSPGAEPLTSHEREGVVYWPVVSKQLKSWSCLASFICLERSVILPRESDSA